MRKLQAIDGGNNTSDFFQAGDHSHVDFHFNFHYLHFYLKEKEPGSMPKFFPTFLLW